MDRRTFTDTTSQWWLNGDALESSVSEIRKDIGKDLGCGRDYEWYRDEKKLDELYTLLENSPDELWRTIDQATNETLEAAWLKDVADLVKSDQPEPEGALADEAHPDHAKGDDAAAEESAPVEKAASVPGPPAKASPFGAMISADLQPAVDDLAALVANVVAEVPGAEELTAQELAELVAEVLAGR